MDIPNSTSFEDEPVWPASYEQSVSLLSQSPRFFDAKEDLNDDLEILLDDDSEDSLEYEIMDKEVLVTRRFSVDHQRKDKPLASEHSPLLLPDSVDSMGRARVRHPHGTCSFMQSTFNSVNAMLGVGVLSLPFAFREGGWIVTTCLLLFLTVLTNYTGKLLRKMMLVGEGINSFPDIAEAAFGFKGRVIVSVIFFVELITAGSMFLILSADNFSALFPRISQEHFLYISALIVLPTASTSKLDFISYFSLIGIVASLYMFFILFYLGAIPSNETEDGGSYVHPQPTKLITSFERQLIIYGLVMVGFAGHAMMPSIHHNMKQPRRYPQMLDITYIIMGVVYLCIGILGYLMYGENTSKEISLNLINGNSSVPAQIAAWLIAISPLTKYGLTINPVALSITEVTDKKIKNKTARAVVTVLMRWFLVLITVLIAVGVPQFDRILGFLGSFFSFFISTIFPISSYIRLFWPSLSTTTKVWNILLIIMSICMAIMGTIGAGLSKG